MPDLIACPDCQTRVSPRAKACPQCGCPLEDAKANVTIQFNGIFMLIDTTIHVSIDGNPVGTGSVKKGLAVNATVPTGDHRLHISIGPRSRTYQLCLPNRGSYIVELSYGRTWGTFKETYKLTYVG